MKELILRTPITHDEYVQFVYDKLDVQPSEVSEVRIPYNIEDINTIEWNIGIILGNSGCGKSSILNTLGKSVPFEYNNENTVISQFKGSGLNPNEASELLFNVGLKQANP